MRFIEQDVRQHLATFFTEYDVPNSLLKEMVADVVETSALQDEGFYSDGDVSLACQRVILSHITNEEGKK